MRKVVVIICLAVFCFLPHLVAAQSRRVPPASGEPKPNRPANVEPKPSPPVVRAVNNTYEPPVEDGDDEIKVDTSLVSIPVRVIDRRNRFIGGLTKENFTVFEDGLQQEIAHFSNEAQPFTVALVLDMSYSTTFKIGEIQSAALAFIDQLRPEDRVMVIAFDQ